MSYYLESTPGAVVLGVRDNLSENITQARATTISSLADGFAMLFTGASLTLK